MMHILLHCTVPHRLFKISNFKKFNMTDGCHFENRHVKCWISATVLLIVIKFYTSMHIIYQKFEMLPKTKMADGRHLSNQNVAISQKQSGPPWLCFAWWRMPFSRYLPKEGISLKKFGRKLGQSHRQWDDSQWAMVFAENSAGQSSFRHYSGQTVGSPTQSYVTPFGE